jgi:predicted nucleic acid-binding Zn finger protein
MLTTDPIIDFVPTPRGELLVGLEPGPVLVIAGGWVRGGRDGEGFAHWDRYAVREVAGRGGRTFVLTRDEKKLLTLAPGADRSREYETTITSHGGWCTCRGYCLNNERREPCKHIIAVRHFADAMVFEGDSDG